jgi:hypothetical protein
MNAMLSTPHLDSGDRKGGRCRAKLKADDLSRTNWNADSRRSLPVRVVLAPARQNGVPDIPMLPSPTDAAKVGSQLDRDPELATCYRRVAVEFRTPKLRDELGYARRTTLHTLLHDGDESVLPKPLGNTSAVNRQRFAATILRRD